MKTSIGTYVRRTVSFTEDIDTQISRLMEPGGEFAGKSYSEAVRGLLRRQVSGVNRQLPKKPENLKIREVAVGQIYTVDGAKLPV